MSMFMFGMRRRPSRWELLRRRLAEAGDLRDRLPDRDALMDLLPDRDDVRGRVQPLMSRAGASRPDISLADAQSFLQERAGSARLPGFLRRPSRRERALDAEAPVWLIVAAVLGGVAAGFALGRATAGSTRSVDMEEFEAAAERIKSAWPAIDDDDIRDARGNMRRLSSVIEERTGENAKSVRERLGTLTAQGHSSNGEGPETE